jgi:peptidylprolyl isomerase
MIVRLTAALAALFLMLATPLLAQELDPQNTVYMDIPAGRVVIKLRPDLAPNHVARVRELIGQHFYDNTPFHRVIPGFMAQGGDPNGDGTGGSDLPNLKAEFSKVPFTRGMIGAARTDDPDSANSQFFIMFGDAPWLNGQYTIWGQVVEGMEFVDKIKTGEPVANPDRIIKMRLAANPD